ncbi:MAG: Gfo/Idh/MocA family oxidoreductase [Deltaproteobacteria bacterium]|nr:Gfo/Idh/MocA family oxidoreductase [Deltaproteobacteria bacterium]
MQVAAAGAVAPLLTRSNRVWGANERISLGFIGCGGITKAHFEALGDMKDAEVIAACDIDEKRAGDMAAQCNKRYGRTPELYADFRKLLERKDIDAVFVASPDHWHGLHLIHACEAGKDVYVEKPLSFTVGEGRAMVKAAEKHKRVVQVGTQQRSNKIYQDTIDYIRSGKLGRVSEVQTWNVYNGAGMGAPADGDPPAGVDYDFWLGPAPKRAFNAKRFHGSWRYFRDYGGGYVTDWNTHHQDIVHLAMDSWSPKSVAMDGFVVNTDDNRDMPDTAKVTFTYDAPQGEFISTYTVRRGNQRPPDMDLTHSDHGIAFYGKNGTLVITRSGWTVYGESRKDTPVKNEGDTKMQPHVRNFLDCIRSRNKTTSDIASMHMSTLVNHIANISWRVGRKVYWNAKTETLFADAALKQSDKEANKLLFRDPRKPWKFPA